MLHASFALQMHTQEAPRQFAAPQQGSTHGSYDRYARQAPAQQAPASQQYEYANPQQQQFNARHFQPPPGQQRSPAHADWAGQSQGRGLALDQSQGSEAYRQMPTSGAPPEPVSNPQQYSNDPAEFGMGRRGVGVFGRGGGQRGQTPPAGAAAGGTGAASVMALGQNKLPQRAEVPSSQRPPCFPLPSMFMKP